MGETLLYSTTLERLECGACHIPFAIPQSMLRDLRQTGKGFRCPNGCSISYHDDENAELKKKVRRQEDSLARERAARDQAEADAEHQRRRANGYKGAAAKVKKRAARGVCPAPGCKRSFVDVARHVTTCHPDFAPADHAQEG